MTATVFVFRNRGHELLLGLIWHHRLSGWMPPGGHVEDWESPPDTAVRETAEELGCRVRLIPGPAAATPAGYPHPLVTCPWFVAEIPASADSHTGTRHMHLDHVFAGLYDGQAGEPEGPVWWASAKDIAETSGLPIDVQLPAAYMFTRIGRQQTRLPS